MAHQDPVATITLVDHGGALQAAQTMAQSIELGNRVDSIEGDPLSVKVPDNTYDIVLLAQRLHSLGSDAASQLLQRAIGAAKLGGRVVVIDLFRVPPKPNLAECIEALKLELETQHGAIPTLEEAQASFSSAGMGEIQFSFLAASRVNLGLMVGICPTG